MIFCHHFVSFVCFTHFVTVCRKIDSCLFFCGTCYSNIVTTGYLYNLIFFGLNLYTFFDSCGKFEEMSGGRLSARLGTVAVSKW